MKSDRTLLGATSALAFLFLLSLCLYLFVPGRLARTVLRFPDEISHSLTPEVRSLPFNWDQEHNVELTVREILLGPARHNHLRLFSRDARLNSVLVRDGKVFIDLSEEAFLPDHDVIYSPQVALEVLKATLMDNFAGVSHVMISVGGEPAWGNLVDKG
jgi:hypothetical protein